MKKQIAFATHMIIALTSNQPCHSLTVPYRAVVAVPVADAASGSLASNGCKTEEIYHAIPMSYKSSHPKSTRVHQLLFNEEVIVLQEIGDEAKIRISNLFLQNDASEQKHTIYFVLKKCLMPIEKIYSTHGSVQKELPQPIDFANQKTLTNPEQKIVTLKEPYYCQKSGLFFSAGTRFVKYKKQKKSSVIAVYMLNSKTKTITTTSIPAYLCIDGIPNSAQAKHKLFLELLRLWVGEQKGCIPYVWGGASYVNRYPDTPFETMEKTNPCNEKFTAYVRSGPAEYPYTGFDCAGLISRAAQMAGIPYFYKNTTTLAKHLTPITGADTIKDGDIVWFPTHVLLVGSVKKNTVIEARSYGHGYGKLQELPLKKVFKDVATFDQLKTLFLEKKPIHRIDKSEVVRDTIPVFKIFKLPV